MILILSKVWKPWIIFLNHDSTLKLRGIFSIRPLPRTHHRPCESQYGSSPRFYQDSDTQWGWSLHFLHPLHRSPALRSDSCSQRNTLQIILDFLSPTSPDFLPVSLSPTISPGPHHSLSNGPVIGQHGLISSSFMSEFQIVIAFITRNNSPLKIVQYLNSLKQLNVIFKLVNYIFKSLTT